MRIERGGGPILHPGCERAAAFQRLLICIPRLTSATATRFSEALGPFFVESTGHAVQSEQLKATGMSGRWLFSAALLAIAPAVAVVSGYSSAARFRNGRFLGRSGLWRPAYWATSALSSFSIPDTHSPQRAAVRFGCSCRSWTIGPGGDLDIELKYWSSACRPASVMSTNAVR